MNWPHVSIAEVTEIVSGATPKTGVSDYWGGDIAWATPADLSDLAGSYIDDTPRKITEAGLRSCAASVLPANSVLFSSRAPIGHVAINTVSMATNQGFKSFVPDSTLLDTKFLFWWLKAHRKQIEAMGSGATFKEVSKATISRVEIPLPPLGEQKRIAAILDKADQLRQERRHAIALLDSLTQAIFLEMFGEEGQSAVSLKTTESGNEEQHRRYLLTDVARLATGHTPDRKIAEYWGGRIPWITLGDIRAIHGRTIHSTRECVTQKGINNSSAVVLPSGTVCLSRTASVGFATIMEGEMATSQDFVNWVCGSTLLPEYLLAALSASRRGLIALATGSTHRTIYFPTVERFTILLPDIEIQRYVVERRRKVVNLLEKSEMSLPRLDSLFSSLQHRAFSGQL